MNHAIGFAAFDEFSKKRLPLTENDFMEVIYMAYLRKNPAFQTLTQDDKLLHIKQKILNLRGYLKLYRNSEMQGMISWYKIVSSYINFDLSVYCFSYPPSECDL